MRKLCLAVVIFSLLGYGPLTSFFHSENGIKESTLQMIEKWKKSETENKGETFLIIEKEAGLLNDGKAMLIRYYDKNKLEVGQVRVPSEAMDLENIKKKITEDYQIEVDYAILYDPEGIEQIFEMLATNGVAFTSDQFGEGDGSMVMGSDVKSLLNRIQATPEQASEWLPFINSLKKTLISNVQTEDYLTLAPLVIDKTLQSVETDIGKGKLMELGIAFLTTTITSIEPLQLRHQDAETNQVNKTIHDNAHSSFY